VWQLNKDIPDELGDIIDNLLEKKPGRRPATAADVQTQLAQLLSRVQQRGLGRRRLRGWSGRRLRRRLAWGAVLMTALIIVGRTTWLVSTIQSTQSNSASTGQGDVQLAEAADGNAADRNVIALTGQIERELTNGFVELHSLIKQADSGTFFLQEADRWDRELNAIEHDLDRIDSYDN
jgi:hypothetical protein